MKNVTAMTDTEKSQNKVNILYMTQNKRFIRINLLRIRPIYLQL